MKSLSQVLLKVLQEQFI
jgi:hypothetical protein